MREAVRVACVHGDEREDGLPMWKKTEFFLMLTAAGCCARGRGTPLAAS